MKDHKFKKKWHVELRDIITSLKTEDLATAFLQNMFTPKELDELAIRLQILKKLKEGKTHRDIAIEVGVGVATVNRGAREIKYKQTDFLEML